MIEIPLEVVSTEYQFNGAESLAIDCDHRHSSSLFDGNDFDNSESVARQQQAEKTTCSLPALLAPLPLTEIPQILTDEEIYNSITPYYEDNWAEFENSKTEKTIAERLSHLITISASFDFNNPIDMQKQDEILSGVKDWVETNWKAMIKINKAA